MTDLRPCPFCGSDGVLVSYGAGLRVECSVPRCAIGPLANPEAEAIAAWNRRAEGWIPVGERLPEAGDNVAGYIVATRHGRLMLGYPGWTGDGELERVDGSRCDDGDGCVYWNTDGLRDEEKECITHWMPLPEPPAETDGS